MYFICSLQKGSLLQRQTRLPFCISLYTKWCDRPDGKKGYLPKIMNATSLLIPTDIFLNKNTLCFDFFLVLHFISHLLPPFCSAVQRGTSRKIPLVPLGWDFIVKHVQKVSFMFVIPLSALRQLCKNFLLSVESFRSPLPYGWEWLVHLLQTS